MADMMVSMGIDDRGVGRGLKRVEDAVRNTGRRIEYQQPKGYDPFRFDKGLGKITSGLTGVSMKFGGVYAVYQALSKAADALERFDETLPSAERKLSRLKDAFTPETGQWAASVFSAIDGLTSGPIGSAVRWMRDAGVSINDAQNFVGDALKTGYAMSGAMGPMVWGPARTAAVLFGPFEGMQNGSSSEVNDAMEKQRSLIDGLEARKSGSLRLMALETELLSVQDDRLAVDKATAELKLQTARAALDQSVRDGLSLKQAQSELEVHRKIRDEASKRADAAARERAEKERSVAADREQANWRSIHREWDVKAGMRFDEMGNRVAAQEAAAVTPAEKLAARLERINLSHEQRMRAAQNMVRDNKFMSDAEASGLYDSINALRDAEVAAASRPGGKKASGEGLDLSGAGAAASVGQAFAYSIPGKIDTTNQLIRQSNQTLREIKDKVDGAARFGP